jgi:hypothetical protein
MEQQDPGWNSMQLRLHPTCKILWKTKGKLKNNARWIFSHPSVLWNLVVSSSKRVWNQRALVGRRPNLKKRDWGFNFKLIMRPPLLLLKEGVVFFKEGKSGKPDPLQIPCAVAGNGGLPGRVTARHVGVSHEGSPADDQFPVSHSDTTPLKQSVRLHSEPPNSSSQSFRTHGLLTGEMSILEDQSQFPLVYHGDRFGWERGSTG